jgi:predicted metal-dependent enzyme (double-stranded beta helix superfamily)
VKTHFRTTAAVAIAFLVFGGSAVAYTTAELAGAIEATLAEGGSETRLMQRVGAALREFLMAPELDLAKLRPHPGLDVTTYLLHVSPAGSFSIAALVIRAGAKTPLHDHQTWTVWGAVRGRDRETRFERRGDGSLFPDLVPLSTRIVTNPAVSLIPGPPGDIHRLENVDTSPSISVHVHGADMTHQTRNVYDEGRRIVTPFVQSYVEIPGGGS